MKMRLPWLSVVAFLRLQAAVVAEEDDDWYDDTRRMSCMKATNEAFAGNDKMDDIALQTLEHMQLEFLVMTKDMFVERESFPGGQFLSDSKKACEEAGGFFDVFSGTLDCQSRKEDRKINSSMTIKINASQCFASVPECEGYTAMQWLIDFEAAMGKQCTGRPGETNLPLSQVHTTMPAGTPIFSKHGYNSRQFNSCFDAFKQIIMDDKYEELADAALSRKEQVDVIQETPILTTYEWFPDDQDESVIEYKRQCDAAGFRWDTFSGTLDCLGTGPANQGIKTTTVIDGAKACFPDIESCSHYSQGAWLADMLLAEAHMSCTVRDVDADAEVEADGIMTGAPTERTADTTSTVTADENDSGGMPIPVVAILSIAVLTSVAFLIHHGQMKSRQSRQHHLGEYELSACSEFGDSTLDLEEDNELPTIS